MMSDQGETCWVGIGPHGAVVRRLRAAIVVAAAGALAGARKRDRGSPEDRGIRRASLRIIACGKRLLCVLPVLLPVVVLAQPSLSIRDTTVQVEGNSGLSAAIFTVTRSASGVASSVQFSTETSSATGGSSCGGNADFISLSGSLAFAASETTKTITVSVCGDSRDEPAERFGVRLHTPSGATIADGNAWGEILDDDPAPILELRSTQIIEGNALSTNAVFAVWFPNPSGFPIRVDYKTNSGLPQGSGLATAGGSCGGDVDYIGTSSGRLEVPAGTVGATITIPVCGDTRWESNEKFTVSLSNPVNATIGDGLAECTITNDDPPVLSVSNVIVTEPAGSGSVAEAVIYLRLSSRPAAGASIHYTCVDRTAIRSRLRTCDGVGDYLLRGGVIELYGTTTVFSVPICHDTAREKQESFEILFSSPTGVTVPDTIAVVTILDND
jgi:hypothetical protein